MPVSAVGRRAGGKGPGGLGKRVVASRVPEGHLVGGKVDFVCHVVPLVGLELRLPLALPADHPLPVRPIQISHGFPKQAPSYTHSLSQIWE